MFMMEQVKRYKYIFIVGGIAAALLILYFLFRDKAAIPSSVDRTVDQDQTTDTREPSSVFDTSKFVLVSVAPPSGRRQTADPFEYIKFKFSQPVAAESVRVQSSPVINLRARVYEKDTYTLVLEPAEEMWQPETEYKITVDGSVSSVEGARLGKTIDCTYFTSPPESIDAGENFFEY